MKFCSTCLPSCPPFFLISTKTKAEEVVVSGQLVFVHPRDPTPSAGSSDAQNISSDTSQIPTDHSLAERLVFVSRVQSPEISTQKNSELFKMPIRISEAPKFQGGFQSPIPIQIPIPIKETSGQVQSTSSNSEVQIFGQRTYLSQGMWDIPPLNSATTLPDEKINYETRNQNSPPPNKITYGIGFMSIKSSGGVPSSRSESDTSIRGYNKSSSRFPTPSPKAPSGGDNRVPYLLV